jgi:iron-sulfur cluster assembly accessory protein
MIQFSPAALNEAKRLKAKRQNANLLFRIGVVPSSCLQWSYNLQFDDTIRADDQVYPCGDLQVVVDANSLQYLEGLVLDYTEDLMGGGFRFRNPNVAQTCGCGHSFDIAE